MDVSLLVFQRENEEGLMGLGSALVDAKALQRRNLTRLKGVIGE